MNLSTRIYQYLKQHAGEWFTEGQIVTLAKKYGYREAEVAKAILSLSKPYAPCDCISSYHDHSGYRARFIVRKKTKGVVMCRWTYEDDWEAARIRALKWFDELPIPNQSLAETNQ